MMEESGTGRRRENAPPPRRPPTLWPPKQAWDAKAAGSSVGRPSASKMAPGGARRPSRLSTLTAPLDMTEVAKSKTTSKPNAVAAVGKAHV